MSIATVKHVSKNHVRIVTEQGYAVTIFNIKGSSVEAVVWKDGEEVARLLVQAPAADERMEIVRQDERVVEIFYHKVEVPNGSVRS
jgi:hypothetical protein